MLAGAQTTSTTRHDTPNAPHDDAGHRHHDGEAIQRQVPQARQQVHDGASRDGSGGPGNDDNHEADSGCGRGDERRGLVHVHQLALVRVALLALLRGQHGTDTHDHAGASHPMKHAHRHGVPMKKRNHVSHHRSTPRHTHRQHRRAASHTGDVVSHALALNVLLELNGLRSGASQPARHLVDARC